MRKALIIGMSLAVLLLLGLGAFLYWLGGDDQSALEKLRDVAVVFLVLLWVLAFVLLVGIAAGVLWLVLAIKEKILPAIDKLVETTGTLSETAQRVKGTAEFVTEEVAAPIISVYGTFAKARAMTRTVIGRDKPNRKRLTNMLKK
jgi:hypothetical protein